MRERIEMRVNVAEFEMSIEMRENVAECAMSEMRERIEMNIERESVAE